MRVAEVQHGLLTSGQAEAAGITRESRRHRVRRGQWEQVATGVFRVSGSPRSWEQRLLTLVLAAGPAAAASHRSAAALLGVPGFARSGAVEVTTPRARRHRSESEIVHRWRPFPAHHLTVVDGIVTTRVARTLCDLAGELHPARTERAVDNCLAMGIATPAALEATYLDLRSRGRKGMALMRRLIADRTDGYEAPASELEARFRDLIRDTDLPEPVRQLDVGDAEGWVGRVDVAYPSYRLLIELDSRRHHSAKLDRQADAARDQRLEGGGWRVVRFVWDDLATAPDRVVSDLRRLLTSSAA